MAPPSARRTGHSRRAQYTTFFGYLAALVGALAGGTLLVISILNPHAFASWRGAANDAAAPAARVATVGRSGSYGLFGTIAGYVMAGSQNARLQKEMAIARVRLAEAQAIADENRRLKALLGLRDADPRPVAIARMISSTAASTRRFASISAGARDGVTVGMPVRSPLGLVGRVLEVGQSSSRVLLVTDTESVVPVRRASDAVPAFITGRSDGMLQLRLINLGINPLHIGDVFVTSGSGGLYRPGVAVAMVTALTRDGAIGRVLSDPAATEYVTVEPVWNPAPELPPAPTPTAPPRKKKASATHKPTAKKKR
ncbi:MAG: rod shape-determining protein MreC [Novosphingobium sp.]|nr:rod shape-determining protein MreC [Novosphingobium sp.]